MARRADGGTGRTFPGLRAALADDLRGIDGTFCLEPHSPCSLCLRIAALEAGQPVEVTAGQIWHALFNAAQPKAHMEFLDDFARYELTGDRIHSQESVTND